MVTATDADQLRVLINRKAWQETACSRWVPRAASKLSAGTLSADQIRWAVEHLQLVPTRRHLPDAKYMLDGKRRYRLRTDTEGRWAGVTTVYAISTKGGETLVKGQLRRRVLAEIARDPLGAAARFGRETRRCPYCRQHLDHAVSVRVGMGEKCASDRGVPWR